MRTDNIRPMTGPEIVASLEQAAKVCVRSRRRDWNSMEVTVQDDAFRAVNSCMVGGVWVPRTSWHAALLLLFVAAYVGEP